MAFPVLYFEYFPFAPLLRDLAFGMTVSIALFKRIRCSGSISSIMPASVEEKVRAVEGIVIWTLAIDKSVAACGDKVTCIKLSPI